MGSILPKPYDFQEWRFIVEYNPAFRKRPLMLLSLQLCETGEAPGFSPRRTPEKSGDDQVTTYLVLYGP